ncbi:MAG: cyclic nucleotide-binding domain-containing protein [Oligoflexia bacterium]|nr:cyclic nucleotide-binding domain-containing protein [Oligoflexia bacterium]
MYLATEQPQEFIELDSRGKKALAELLRRLPVHGVERTIIAQQSLEFPATDGRLYVVQEGALPCTNEDRLVCFYDQGDLVGFPHSVAKGLLTITADFAVRVIEFKSSEFLDAVWVTPQTSKLWNEYLACQQALLIMALSSSMRSEIRLAPEVQTIDAGTVIIQQGGKADKVFTVLEGHCDVLVDGTKVAELGPDEIFGAMAVAIEAPRTATVKARDRVVLMSVAKEKFLDLIESRPGTTLKLIQDLSRAIVNLNSKLVQGR